MSKVTMVRATPIPAPIKQDLIANMLTPVTILTKELPGGPLPWLSIPQRMNTQKAPRRCRQAFRNAGVVHSSSSYALGFRSAQCP
jgi:hypothetical protein